jgi:integrase
MNSITPVEADQWVVDLKKRYATATVARLIKFAKQFYTAAKRAKLVTESPFTDIKAGSMSNPNRIRFVTREEITKVMDACPNGTWRLIIALARFGGLRCPTELLTLTWGDIDWERNRFLVKSTKTAHHEKGGRRWVPIFPELRPHLEAEFDRIEPGTVQVVTFPQGKETNLRTQFEQITVKAGLLPWTRPFQNLRASRETELCQAHPLHVVTEWIGNSAIVAAKHYLSVTEADFEKALQNPVQSVSGGRRPELTIIPSGIENALKVAGCRDVSLDDCTAEYTRRDSNPQPSVPKTDALSS